MIDRVILQMWTNAKYPACVPRSVRTRKAVTGAVVTKVMSGKVPITDVELLVI